MPAVTLGILGNLDYAKELGKKGTESDVHLYTFREGDVNVSMIVPFRHPEKVQPLAYAVNSGDAVLIIVKEVTRELGESILAAAAAGHTRGLIVLQNYVQPEQVQPLLKGTTLEALKILTDDKPATVRQEIIQLATQPREGNVRIPIDHHFNVKGIGTVILGFVERGTVKRHDTLRAYPTTTTCIVRSIQVHDVDTTEAHTGDHVGLALKNIDNEDIDRGFVLAPEGSLHTTDAGQTLTLNATVSPWFKPGIKNEGSYYIAHGWQIVNARSKTDLGPGQQGPITLELLKPLAHEPGDRIILLNLDNPGQRIVGHGVL